MTDTPNIIQNSKGVWQLEGEQLWDTDLLPIIIEHINPGDTVIDAGAWIGGHTMAYAEKVGVNGNVIAFEPNLAAFECLSRNLKGSQNTWGQQIALGDAHKEVSFYTKKGWYDSGYVGSGGDANEVWMDTLDSYELAPNFIKIDVEGCELKVLKGGEKTIENHRPKMVIEINKPALNRQGDDYTQVLSWLLKHRYVMHPAEKDVTDDTEIYNIIAIPV